MPRPFGAWAPATTIAELKARTPRPSQFKIRPMFEARHQVYYSPEAMAHFKDPQQFKDAVDKLRAMAFTDKFWGYGVKEPHHVWKKTFAVQAVFAIGTLASMQYFYGTHMPAVNPSWRKIFNKEWEEAINNSPWDHRSHVWQYSDVYAAQIGSVVSGGPRKFYIPA